MEQYCTSLYYSLQAATAALNTSPLPPCKNLEGHYRLAVAHWMQLANALRHHRFPSDECEIRFFKTGKPMLTAEIEYVHLRYHALLFEPDEQKLRVPFWVREYGRLERFRAEHREFIQCYEDERHERQAWYFLRKQYRAEHAAGARIYDSDAAVSANGDWLTATRLALERYRAHVQKILEHL